MCQCTLNTYLQRFYKVAKQHVATCCDWCWTVEMNLSNGWHQCNTAQWEQCLFDLQFSLYFAHLTVSSTCLSRCLSCSCFSVFHFNGNMYLNALAGRMRLCLTQPLSCTRWLNFKALVLALGKCCEEPSEVMLRLRVESVHLRWTVQVMWMTVDVSDASCPT